MGNLNVHTLNRTTSEYFSLSPTLLLSLSLSLFVPITPFSSHSFYLSIILSLSHTHSFSPSLSLSVPHSFFLSLSLPHCKFLSLPLRNLLNPLYLSMSQPVLYGPHLKIKGKILNIWGLMYAVTTFSVALGNTKKLEKE